MDASTQQKIADKIASVRDDVQAFMNKNITSYETRMSSGAIYKAMKIADVTPTDFQLGLSMSVRLGLIEGFRGIRGKNGGYAPAVETSDNSGDSEAGSKNIKGSIRLDDGVSLESNDENNWCLSGLLTHNRYWPTFAMAIKNTSKHLLDHEIRTLTEDGMPASKIIERIAEAEKNICAKLDELNPNK